MRARETESKKALVLLPKDGQTHNVGDQSCAGTPKTEGARQDIVEMSLTTELFNFIILTNRPYVFILNNRAEQIHCSDRCPWRQARRHDKIFKLRDKITIGIRQIIATRDMISMAYDGSSVKWMVLVALSLSLVATFCNLLSQGGMLSQMMAENDLSSRVLRGMTAQEEAINRLPPQKNTMGASSATESFQQKNETSKLQLSTPASNTNVNDTLDVASSRTSDKALKNDVNTRTSRTSPSTAGVAMEAALSPPHSGTGNKTFSLLPPPTLATDISEEVHIKLSEAKNDNGIPLANLSSVDYHGCCGLGHRLSRMANAAWVAKRLNFAMHAFWGHCGNDTEVYQHLFGTQNKQDLKHVTSTNHHVIMRNEVVGTRPLRRWGPNSNECSCHPQQINAHREFYEDLRNRFRYRKQVDAYVNHTFANHTVLGMHIRAGNGEKRDFRNKGRGINNVTTWVKEASMRIVEIVKKGDWKDPPLLYIATDTPSMIDNFRSELNGVMPVTDFPQERAPEGKGILIGEKGKAHLGEMECIRGWENAVMDMILLSHADLLISARVSSFVQTMPMSLVFGRPADQQKVQQPVCELNLNASAIFCSESFMQWCCKGSPHDTRDRNLRESITIANPVKELNMSLYEPKLRPPDDGEPTKMVVPYYWKPMKMYSNDAKN